MDAKELLRMNVLKLREEALKVPGAVGVTSMKKEELVKLLANAHGIVLEPKRTTSAEKTEVKQHIPCSRPGGTRPWHVRHTSRWPGFDAASARSSVAPVHSPVQVGRRRQPLRRRRHLNRVLKTPPFTLRQAQGERRQA